MAKKFKGNRPLAIIKHRLETQTEKGFWDQTGYDRGEDWVNFGFEFDGIEYKVLFNTFNGTFLIPQDDGTFITERNSELDDEPWYAFLLDLIYESEDEQKKVGA